MGGRGIQHPAADRGRARFLGDGVEEMRDHEMLHRITSSRRLIMREASKNDDRPCHLACTEVVKFLTDHDVPANSGISLPPYTSVDGYRYLNIFVRFEQEEGDEPPVDLGVIFAFDDGGAMGARRYVNLEENLSRPQGTNFIEVSGQGSWHGSQWKLSSFLVRLPVMGPYAQVFVYNRAPVERKVSVWGYLVS